jgi:DNA-binding XRE family transcriptional regulator
MNKYDQEVKQLQAEAAAQLKRDFAVAEQRANADLLLVDRRLLGFQLAEVRRKRGLSQAEVARRAGLRQARVSNAESGKANPSLNTLLKIAGALEARLVLEYQ